jgi:hypothetical protein
MENLSQDLEPIFDSESNHITPKKIEIAQSRAQNRDRDSLSENFNDEIEAWARQAMASNGFGDY